MKMNAYPSNPIQTDPNPEPAWEVALLFPPQGAWDEADYLRLDTNRLVEFSQGRVEVLPMPTDRHQTIVALLFTILHAYAQRSGGKALFAPLRLRLWPGKIREPDLLFLVKVDDPRRTNDYWTGADLVIEVVSPDDPARDYVVKRREYAQAGIQEYWIVDPASESVTMLSLSAAAPPDLTYVEQGVFERGTILISSRFAGLEVAVGALFTENS